MLDKGPGPWIKTCHLTVLLSCVLQQQQQKAHEQALVQLNEQLQLNMLQQAQLLQEKKLNGKQSQQQLQVTLD